MEKSVPSPTTSTSSEDFGVGLACCALSSVFFGSMFVPIRPYDTGDGFFVQWVMGCAIFCVGTVVQLIRVLQNAHLQFYPVAMIGGFLWATGNITACPIINTIGMAIGILLWSTTNMLLGWASGRFGWFNTFAQVPASDALNALGLALGIISAVMFAFVKSRPLNSGSGRASPRQSTPAADSLEDTAPLLEPDFEEDGENTESGKQSEAEPPCSKVVRPLRERVLEGRERMLAIGGSVIAGIFYGLCFAPVIYIQDNYEDASRNGLDYVFSHYCGILVTCTFYLLCYCAYKQNRPMVNSQTVFPGFLAGVCWAIAQTSWFVANDRLSEAVSFPIITRFPGVVAALWGVCYFKEIRGARNLRLLVAAIFITVCGGILSGLSKVIKW